MPNLFKGPVDAELEAIQRSKIPVPRSWNKQPPNQDLAAKFTALMQAKSSAPAEALAQMDIRKMFGTKALLDVAGGSGAYAVSLSRHGIRCAVFELPAMCEAASRYLKDTNVPLIAGDAFVELPTGFDTHLLVDTLHMFEHDDAVKILRNCHRALPPNGTVLVSNAVIPDQFSSHRTALYFQAVMYAYGTGRGYSAVEFKSMLTQAGFVDIAFLPYYSHFILISARKK